MLSGRSACHPVPVAACTRSAGLTHFAHVARQLDAAALVRAAGLPASCIDDPDLTVPATAGARLLELAAPRGHEPAFGLRMAESRRLLRGELGSAAFNIH